MKISSSPTEESLKISTASESTQIPLPEDGGIILHVTDSDLELFTYHDTDKKKIENKEDCIEKRTVTLKNLIVKDSIGSPAFAY